tara:strand:- start:472 stop:816 length:345 start_codon:yes stop_codon:yes gene_type:complete
MTSKEFNKLRNSFIDSTLKLSDRKRIEYTEGNHNDNVLWNFESIANDLGLTPMQVLSVYLNKHMSSLRNYFKDGKEYSEPIEGRVSDMINYLLLLVAMLRQYKLSVKEKRGVNG